LHSKVLRAGQAPGKIEAGIDVSLSNIDDLAVERHGALVGRVEGFLPTVEYGFDSILKALIQFTSLNDVLLGARAHPRSALH